MTAARCASGPTRSSTYRSATPGIGDGGPPGASTNPYSQDRGALEGKVLRLELDGLTPAAGNPFIGVAGARPEVYRLRAAQSVPDELRPADRPPVGGRRRSGHDRGDRHHPVRRELRLAALRGHAAGRLPGGRDTRARHRSRCSSTPHSGAGGLGNSVTGGAFATRSFGQLGGQYFFGDFTASKLFVAAPNAARDDIGTPAEFVTNAGGPVDIVFGPDEALYYVAINVGQVRRVVPGYARPAGRVADARLARAGIPGVRLSGPHTRPAARVRLLQPAGGASPASSRSAPPTRTARLRPRSGFVRFAVQIGDPATPADEADVALRLRDHRRAPALRPGRLHGRAARERPDPDHRQGQPTPRGGRVRRHHDGQPDRLHRAVHGDAGHGRSARRAPSRPRSKRSRRGRSRRACAPTGRLGRIEVFDGGPDDDADTTPNTLFATQGVFVP